MGLPWRLDPVVGSQLSFCSMRSHLNDVPDLNTCVALNPVWCFAARPRKHAHVGLHLRHLLYVPDPGVQKELFLGMAGMFKDGSGSQAFPSISPHGFQCVGFHSTFVALWLQDGHHGARHHFHTASKAGSRGGVQTPLQNPPHILLAVVSHMPIPAAPSLAVGRGVV